MRDIQYHLDNANDFLITERLPYIFKDKIYALSHVHNLEIGIYDMKGQLLKSSRPSLQLDENQMSIPQDILMELNKDLNHRVMRDTLLSNEDYLSIYSYIYDHSFTPIGILNIPYLGKTNFYQKELKQLLLKISYVFFIAILVSVALAYFLSQIISSPLKAIAVSMKDTRLYKENKKIQIKTSGTEELHDLVNAYNGMIDELENNAVKLAQSERERAWREMAKQVAHEIKNPLTPMRLNIQSFERNFDPNDPNIKERVEDLSQSLIQQIDTMTSIASAFSDFAKMPIAKKELIDIVNVVDNAVDFFGEDYITFNADKAKIDAVFDRNQLVRIINNLVTNAQQALTEKDHPSIKVSVKEQANVVEITVADNGKGIEEENRDKIFEPKFTTKSSGMGLGLAMVKNILHAYNGSIDFTSQVGVGTTFTVRFPK
ncbi:MAG: two-component sensor histidine kinase [Flavobacteriales bacterium]|nr:MAG: two-component sensor histidine kinase [Flavobacteriales bacterium]